MFNPTAMWIQHTIACLQAGYRQVFGHRHPHYEDVIGQVATTTLHAIARTDALYHDVEHTILVTLVGQEILRGKHLLDGTVSAQDWLHLIVALLCHDIGYLKGICREDCPNNHTYTTGHGTVVIQPGTTDASLTPYHVDRGKQFVAENLGIYHPLDISILQELIELTRFPIPQGARYQDTMNLPGLARAADLIGQLGDARYLEKLPALFHEFEEVGTNQALDYQHPGDLRLGYPQFFQSVVQPLIQPAVRYLQTTHEGRQVIHQLGQNVSVVERELAVMAIPTPDRPASSVWMGDRYHFFLDELAPQDNRQIRFC
ncbi:MAG: metal-dependent phosphohydrolase [Leptolyngbyaceae cyanobacterium bins.349]|nr:metal-dependent phosphohydrolase [Leptolyngbyaceae cyanobacterium bins.349]